MELYSVPSLVDAKNDYTRKLTRILKKAFMVRILKLYEDVRENCLNFHEEEKVLIIFQERLSDIASWNNEQKNELSDEIISVSSCDWIDDLITAVFVLHTKILGTIRSKNPPKKINIDIPDTKEFIYMCYLDIAREIWKHVYLFQETSDSCTYQKNYNECETLIANSISETIREMLPVKELLREHLANLKFKKDDNDDADDAYDADDADDDADDDVRDDANDDADDDADDIGDDAGDDVGDDIKSKFSKKKGVKNTMINTTVSSESIMNPVVETVMLKDSVKDMDTVNIESNKDPLVESHVLDPVVEPLIIKDTVSDPVVSFDSLISGDDSKLTPILSDTVKIEPETKDVFIGKASCNDSKPSGFAELDFRNMGGGDTFHEKVNLDYNQC